MGTFLNNRDGGKTGESGQNRWIRQLSSNDQGNIRSSHMVVAQHSTPGMSVDIAVGELFISYLDYGFWTWTDSIQNPSVPTSDPTNPRIDAIVAYVDLTVVSSASNNNPGALKFKDVAGTPAGSPTAPSGATIQASVGAGNPYYQLATVAVGAAATTVVNANITDSRAKLIIGSTSKYLMFVPGSQPVADNVSINPPVYTAQTVTTLIAHCKTAPTVTGATFRVWNITQGVAVASVTIAAGSTDASTTTMTNASLNASDTLRCDVTAQGTVLAADTTVTLL